MKGSADLLRSSRAFLISPVGTNLPEHRYRFSHIQFERGFSMSNGNQQDRDGAGKSGTERDRNGDNQTDRDQAGTDNRKSENKSE